MEYLNKIFCGDSLEILKALPDEIVNTCITSPPYYGLRDYGVDGQIGLEETPEKYVQRLVDVFREAKRVLRKDGTLWLNLGDTYSAYKDCKSVSDSLRVGGKSEIANIIEKGKSNSRNSKLLKSVGLKNKDLIGIPWMVAFALRSDGWYLRSDIIWSKPNPMPESVTDRPTKSHEYIFLLSKSQKYYYDYESILEIASGYDGRKDTFMKGGVKWKNSTHTMAKRGHERWKYKNLQEDGQMPNTFHEKRVDGLSDEVYPVRNKRSVWDVNTEACAEAHFAVFPQKLIEPCLKAGCPVGGVVLDPFIGSGTVGILARKQDKNFIGIDLNPEYLKIAQKRMYEELGMFA